MTNHIDSIALCIGYAALGALTICALGGAYLCAYEICKAIGSRIFFPVWAWHIATTIACVKVSRTPNKAMYVRYLFAALEKHEEKHPDLRGLLDEYAEERVRNKQSRVSGE